LNGVGKAELGEEGELEVPAAGLRIQQRDVRGAGRDHEDGRRGGVQIQIAGPARGDL